MHTYIIYVIIIHAVKSQIMVGPMNGTNYGTSLSIRHMNNKFEGTNYTKINKSLHI